MKKYLFLAIILLSTACTNDELKFETFSPEAFAYDLGENWEVNALVNVRGFEQREHISNKSFEASLTLSADIKTPGDALINGVFADTINVNHHEEILDIPLEVQFELDSTYSLGKYQVIINIIDEYSKNIVTTSVEFVLTE